MSAASRGETHLASGDNIAAVQAFTEALAEAPNSPNYFINRSIAHHRLRDYAAALQDCESAVDMAYKRGNRSSRGLAQFRRSVALFCLDRPHDADFCLGKAVADGCKEKSISVWQAKISAAMKNYPVPESHIAEIPHLSTNAMLDDPDNTADDHSSDAAISGTSVAPAPKDLGKPVKFEWYQNSQTVIISFYVKNVQKDKCNITIRPESLAVEIPLAESHSEYVHEIDQLFDHVDPAQSSFRVLSTKIEISLHKGREIKWPTLEASATDTSATTTSISAKTPAYPTSSRTGPKNWEAIGSSVEEEHKDGDAALTNLFQTLYKDADEDTKKAMIKSYTESGGTSLSTDWKSVGKSKVEVSPPDGMVARRYES